MPEMPGCAPVARELSSSLREMTERSERVERSATSERRETRD